MHCPARWFSSSWLLVTCYLNLKLSCCSQHKCICLCFIYLIVRGGSISVIQFKLAQLEYLLLSSLGLKVGLEKFAQLNS